MSKKTVFWVTCISSLVLILSVVTFSFIFLHFNKETKKEEKINTSDNTIITPNTKTMQDQNTEITIFYKKCGHSITVKNAEPDTPTVVDGYCPNHYIVKLANNTIITYKTSNMNSPLQVIPFDSSILSEDEVKSLTEGVVFDSYEDYLEYLENFNE